MPSLREKLKRLRPGRQAPEGSHHEEIHIVNKGTTTPSPILISPDSAVSALPQTAHAHIQVPLRKSQETPVARNLRRHAPSVDDATSALRNLRVIGDGETLAETINGVGDPYGLNGLQPKLWNNAYDKLKDQEKEIVERYEDILIKQLAADTFKSDGTGTDCTEISSDPTKRQSQMERLVQIGLKQTEKSVSRMEIAHEGLQVITPLMKLVGSAASATPGAAIAWVGVSFSMNLLTNPVSEAKAQRDGLQYVLARMKWYWHLAGLLLERPRASRTEMELRSHLESGICDLYGKIMLYQMKSLCRYSRHGAIRFSRDILKLDDWEAQLEGVKACEKSVDFDSQQFNSQEQRLRMRSLLDSSRQMESTLDGIKDILERQLDQRKGLRETKDYRACMRHLHITNPRHDKTRIEETKGGLLRDVYRLTMDSGSFRHWNTDPNCRLLWIHGEPGKGKTMLVCGAIDDLQDTQRLITYFLCEAGDDKLNSATNVLRGLIHLLVVKSPFLMQHLIAEYQITGEAMFNDNNAWTALSASFSEMLQDPKLPETTIIIDALDECVVHRPRLLKFIATNSYPNVKWLVSSRPRPGIEERLLDPDSQAQTSLSLNLDDSSNAEAVEKYIEHRVKSLARLKRYNDELQEKVRQYLVDHAQYTFLWVALVCQELEGDDVTRKNTPKVLETFPTGLDALYARMLKQVKQSSVSELCKRVLAIASVTYRPLTLGELRMLDEQLQDELDGSNDLEEVLDRCGSFLTRRHGVVAYIHNSAREYVVEKAATDVIPLGLGQEHSAITLRCIGVLRKCLHYNMYELPHPGASAEGGPPRNDPLADAKYSCLYWIKHLDWLEPWTQNTTNDSLHVAIQFIETHFLHWVEALSLLREIPHGARCLSDKVDNLQLQTSSPFHNLLYDAHRFITFHQTGLMLSPLQVYPALLFTPRKSLIRQLFKQEEPDWILSKPPVSEHWDACLQTFEVDIRASCVAFSPDGQLCASGGGLYDAYKAHYNASVTVCDIKNGTSRCLQAGYIGTVLKLLFTPDSQKLASVSDDQVVRVWSIETGEIEQTFSLAFLGEDHGSWIAALASTRNAILVACVAAGYVCISDLNEQPLYSFGDETSSTILWAGFSQDTEVLATAGEDKAIRIWHIRTETCLATISIQADIERISISPDGSMIATASDTNTISLWQTGTGNLDNTYQEASSIFFMAFSLQNNRLATCGQRHLFSVRDLSTGEVIHSLKSMEVVPVQALSLSPDGQCLAIGYASRIEIWDIGLTAEKLASEITDQPNCLAASLNHRVVAVGMANGLVKTFSTDAEGWSRTFAAHSSRITSICFATTQRWMGTSATKSESTSHQHDKSVKIWNMDTTCCIMAIDSGHFASPESITFDPLAESLIVGDVHGAISVFNVTTGSYVQGVESYNCSHMIVDMSFSADASSVAVLESSGYVRLFKSRTWECCMTLGPISRGSFSGNLWGKVVMTHDRQVVAWLGDSDLHAWLITRDDPVRTFGHLDKALEWARSGHHNSYGVSSDGAWVTKGKRRLFWLAPEYQAYIPLTKTTIGSSIWIGSAKRGTYPLKLRDNLPFYTD